MLELHRMFLLNNYNPIDCALHEHYQLAVIKRASLDLVWIDAGGMHKDRVLAKDVSTHSQAEYLSVHSKTAGEFEIRLDFIREARWAIDGKLLGV